MPAHEIASALQRVASVLERRPEAAVHDDTPASVRWDGGVRCVARHPNGAEVPTDMPREFGGGGGEVTPGWLFRAGLASCAATCIALLAAREGVALRTLEVRAASRSDTRGMLGMADDTGATVPATPQNLELQVRVEAEDLPPERLRALVERACRQSPVPCAVQTALPLALHVAGAD
ncbi:OsmC family protein [Variovorax sp. ZT4R33]|uniref:OsmC family protein n=1 Tax=Variovorax sp. ZT4R33 TaxID=3443743 RepID=UPI003F47884B